MIERILANCEGGMDLRDQAAVFHTSHDASQLGVELVRRNIPFVKFGGLKFLKAAHVKDVLAVLRWGENPHHHVAALRVLKLIPGIGPATARRALLAFERKGHDFSTLECFRPPAAAAEMMQGLAGVMKQLVKSSIWEGQIERLRVWYDPILDLVYDDPRPRRSDLAGAHGSAASLTAELPHRSHARSAGSVWR